MIFNTIISCIVLQKVRKQDRNIRVNLYERFETRQEKLKWLV